MPAARNVDRVLVGDVPISYRRAGEGPTLVMLHGFLCDSRCWRTQLDGLAGAFDVIAWDAPGAGATPDPSSSYTIEDWSLSLEGFLDGLGIERAALVGLSWGGLLAQVFCARSPERVTHLVLADTYAGWGGSMPPDVCRQRLERCEADSRLPPDEFVRRWVPEMFSEYAPTELLEELSGIFAEFHPEGFRLMAKSLADSDTRALMPTLDVPTLLLWGEADRRSSLEIALQMREAIPRAELTVIPGAGHVSNMERPVQFNDAVRRFCSK